MNEEKYFVIRNSDGDTRIDVLSKEELDERLTPDPDEDGAHWYGTAGVLDAIPDNSDTNYWGNNILVIKGHVVGPKL